MTATDKKLAVAVGGVLVLIYLMKRGGFGFAANAGPFTFGAGITGAGQPAGGSAGAAAGPGGGGCGCGCSAPAGGPIVGNYGNFAQGGGLPHTITVPASWLDASNANSPGWINVGVGGTS
jgi:hypothetical protein